LHFLHFRVVEVHISGYFIQYKVFRYLLCFFRDHLVGQTDGPTTDRRTLARCKLITICLTDWQTNYSVWFECCINSTSLVYVSLVCCALVTDGGSRGRPTFSTPITVIQRANAALLGAYISSYRHQL